MSNIGSLFINWWLPGGTIAFTPPVFAVPSAPRMLVATPANESIILNWMPPSSDGNQPILRYERRRTGADNMNFSGWRDIGLVLTETVRGLDNGSVYGFEVRAVNSVGDGDAASVFETPALQITNRLLWSGDRILWGSDHLRWSA